MAEAPNRSQRCALIPGIAGQEGSYLAQLLLAKGCTMNDNKRRASSNGLRYACNGIRFNHESSRSGERFVFLKITCGLASIDAGLDDCLYMGHLDSLREWGHARDYVEMQWRIHKQEGPQDDFVIATGRQETAHRFLEITATERGWGGIEWEGTGKYLISAAAASAMGWRCGSTRGSSAPRKWKPCSVIWARPARRSTGVP